MQVLLSQESDKAADQKVLMQDILSVIMLHLNDSATCSG